jgi:hypothetical protein
VSTRSMYSIESKKNDLLMIPPPQAAPAHSSHMRWILVSTPQVRNEMDEINGSRHDSTDSRLYVPVRRMYLPAKVHNRVEVSTCDEARVQTDAMRLTTQRTSCPHYP